MMGDVLLWLDNDTVAEQLDSPFLQAVDDRHQFFFVHGVVEFSMAEGFRVECNWS